MRSSALAVALAFTCIGASLLSGCGGSSGSPAPAGPPAGQSAQEHLQALTAPGAQVDLAREAEFFATYHSQYPADPAGSLGYAVTHVGVAADQIARKYGLSGGMADLGNLPAALGNLSGAGLASGWRQALALATGRGAKALAGSRAEALPLAAFAADVRAVLAPALRESIAALAPAVSASGPVLTFTDDAETITVLPVDALAYRAALEGALAAADAACAYSWESGDFVWGRPLAELDANGDNLVAPAEYLPGGAFLTLTDAASLAEGFSMLGASLADAGQVAALMKQGQPGSLLASAAPDADWNAAALAVAAAQAALAGPVPLPIQYTVPESQAQLSLMVTVDLRAFWTNPPADARALMPTLRLAEAAGGGTQVQVASIPDKTFAGLLPNAENEIPSAVWAYLFSLPLN